MFDFLFCPSPDYLKNTLFLAAMQGNFKKVKRLIEWGTLFQGKADINTYDKFWGTILCCAANTRSLELVKYLIDKGADIEARNKYKQTPLLIAIEEQRKNNIQYLINAGADVHAVSEKGITALMIAARLGDVETTRTLLEHKVNIHALNEYDETALQIAAEKGHAAIVGCLIKHDATIKTKPSYYEAVRAALSNKKFKTVSVFIENGFDINKETIINSPIPSTLLTQSIFRNAPDEIQFLIDNGVDINMQDNTSHTGLMSSLFISNAVEAAVCLLENGADINKRDFFGRTALIQAVKRQNIDHVKLLVEYGADIDIKDDDGKTAIDFATRQKKKAPEILTYLLEVKKNPKQYQTKAANVFKKNVENLPIETLDNIHLNSSLLQKIICFNQLETALNRLSYEKQMSFYLASRHKVSPSQKQKMEEVIRQRRLEKERGQYA